MMRSTAELKYVTNTLCTSYIRVISTKSETGHTTGKNLNVFEMHATSNNAPRCYTAVGRALIPSFAPLRPDHGHSFREVVGNEA